MFFEKKKQNKKQSNVLFFSENYKKMSSIAI